jgi:UDP:flavonoid glycosyltransferase YjiC (YdhE family)
MMQSICYGKRSIIIPVPDHPEQYGNARRAQEYGVAYAIHQRSIDRDRILLLAEEMLGDDSFQERLSELNPEHMGDGVGKSIEALADIMHL